MKKNTWIILISFFISMISTTAYSADNEASVDTRLNRLERLVNSKGLVDIMVRVESMQSELQRLVGEIELQKHSLEEIKKRQRDLYVDIDRRLLQIERRAGSGTAPMPLTPVPTQTPITQDSKSKSSSTSSVSAVPAAKATQSKEGEQIAYQKAFDLLRALRYEKATQAFRQFLNDYPDGRYAHIAQYWLAETSYHTRKYDVAVKDYQTLIDQHPKSPKRADALLKIGYSQFELKSFAKAESVLQQLIQAYPGTTEAGQAENLLQEVRMQKAQ
ncbi:MAG: tol-pal system protein YbgF [Gammaproteobacteria bacterium]|nr:tol-pal system protein YbgF [Gammaproteobacteria bacterium]